MKFVQETVSAKQEMAKIKKKKKKEYKLKYWLNIKKRLFLKHICNKPINNSKINNGRCLK
jgi:ribosomal protein L18E